MLSVEATSLEKVLRPVIDPNAPKKIAKGLDASPGAAVGQVVFTSEDAQALVEKGKPRCIGSIGNLTRGHPRNDSL